MLPKILWWIEFDVPLTLNPLEVRASNRTLSSRFQKTGFRRSFLCKNCLQKLPYPYVDRPFFFFFSDIAPRQSEKLAPHVRCVR